MTTGFKHVYGPVPSRRLGRSLGVDLVPFKTCTYDCIYCQLGRTTNKSIERKEYVAVDEALAELETKLSVGPAPDYISLAGSGEPTLNLRIGDLIDRIKALTRIPVAVLTNGSLLWMPEVQEALMAADLVLPSLDAGDESLFQHVNRPHAIIAFETMVQGLAEFTKRFSGSVWLEVFLLAGVTGIPNEVEKIAAFTRQIHPARVQLNTVSRPPAEEFAFAVDKKQLARLGRLMPGTVEVISENKQIALCGAPVHETTNGEIVALLSRRPCTLHGICSGLGLNLSEAAKRLEVLTRQGLVRTVRKDNGVFFETSRAR
jgi:wyosine [tRNA(Phe)-imidazoG37] synthetase (radical SAM superfamily)